ncbi:iron ABC transporter substrate-binding protein [Sphaerimonospora sp. CA-214678]|uniref:iron ABC transporter substrate-binding protein n=1 Tax=Sphaerimonospora sp. CA-214678 TaxID=3240029 RepID=UPI003D92AE6C
MAGIAALTMLTAACGTGSPESDAGTLTLYNAQHDDLVEAMVAGFTKETGIQVDIRSGKDFELANQLVQEGDASPADVFLTENSPAMVLVDSKQGFAEVDAETLAQVPGQYVPSSRNWVGFAARSTVLVYNSTALTPDRLPESIMDLARPEWQGKIGIAAGGADFQAIVSAVVAVKGEEAAAEWLKGLKTNAKIYPRNGAVMKAVNDGEIEAGIIYHYYWYKDRAESGANSANTELKFFGGKDPGAFVSVSGAGVLKSSKRPEQAQQLVKYLTSKNGQQILSDSTALEYSIASDVPANPALKPLDELDPPAIDVAALNGPKVVELMQQAGLL